MGGVYRGAHVRQLHLGCQPRLVAQAVVVRGKEAPGRAAAQRGGGGAGSRRGTLALPSRAGPEGRLGRAQLARAGPGRRGLAARGD